MATTEAVTTSEAPQWTFGDRLRKAREHRRLEQSDLADRLGVSRAVVSKWERGSQPRDLLDVARRWAAVTEVPVEWLLGLSASGYKPDGPLLTSVAFEHDMPVQLTFPPDRPSLASVT